jgi:hypothetical protein
MSETWKKIKVPGPACEVSDMGNIRQKRMIVKGCELTNVTRKLSTSPNGFRYLGFRQNGEQVNKYVHLLVADKFLPGKGRVVHINGDRSDNRAVNLERVQ